MKVDCPQNGTAALKGMIRPSPVKKVDLASSSPADDGFFLVAKNDRRKRLLTF